MSSDALYTSCIDDTLKLYSQLPGAIAYMYLFAYKGSNSLVNVLVDNSQTIFDTGVCHGDELFYLFDLKISSHRLSSRKDMQIRERILTLWTDFAKHGSEHRFHWSFISILLSWSIIQFNYKLWNATLY